MLPKGGNSTVKREKVYKDIVIAGGGGGKWNYWTYSQTIHPVRSTVAANISQVWPNLSERNAGRLTKTNSGCWVPLPAAAITFGASKRLEQSHRSGYRTDTDGVGSTHSSDDHLPVLRLVFSRRWFEGAPAPLHPRPTACSARRLRSRAPPLLSRHTSHHLGLDTAVWE